MTSFIVRTRTLMIPDAQVITFRLDVGIDHLVIEKLRVQRLACDAPIVVIEQAPEEAQLALVVEDL